MSIVRFNLSRLYNFFIILFRRKKKLSVNSLYYFRYWRFSNAYVVLDFQVSNAIWFRLGNLSGTKFNKPIVLNLNQINEDQLILEFIGLFQKRSCTIDLRKEASLNSGGFRTEIKHIHKVSVSIPDSRVHISDVNCIRYKPHLSQKHIQIQNQNLRIKLFHFNIEEHI
jgi:hypothetical protein